MKFGTFLSRSHIEEVRALRDGTLTISVRCPSCDRLQTITAPAVGVRLWEKGEYIQNALPSLSKEERELLQTGTCETCWDRLYKNL